MAEDKEPQGTPQEPTQAMNAEGTPDLNRLAVVGIGASGGRQSAPSRHRQSYHQCPSCPAGERTAAAVDAQDVS